MRSILIVADVFNKEPSIRCFKSGNILVFSSLGNWNRLPLIVGPSALLGECTIRLPSDGKGITQIVFPLEFTAFGPIAEILARALIFCYGLISDQGVLEARLQVVDLFVELDL